jgi:hypothetical protein
VWAVSASVMDVDWCPVPSPCLTLMQPFLNISRCINRQSVVT